MKNYIAVFGVKLLALSISLASYGDDLELYKSVEDASKQRSNVLFVLDTSTSMGTRVEDSREIKVVKDRWGRRRVVEVYKDRMEVLQDVTKNVIEKLALEKKTRVGMMRFSSLDQGGMVIVPTENIEINKNKLISEVDKFVSKGNTPLAETMHEAYLYFSGKDVLYGKDSYENRNRNDYKRESVAGSRNGDKYKSPIEHICQANNIVLFTDGDPTSDDSSAKYISEKYIEVMGEEDKSLECRHYWGNYYYSNDCLAGIAEILNKDDLRNDNDKFPGIQNVTTHVIGFNLNDPSSDAYSLLNETARRGGSIKPYHASNEDELLTAMNKIFNNISDDASTVSSPSITVNQFSKASHENYTFYAMFKPSTSGKWEGNIKKYQLASRFVDNVGKVVDDSELTTFEDASSKYKVKLFLEDRNNTNILDNTGKVKKETRDLWNNQNVDDGGKVNTGGIRSAMVGQNWNFYTFDEQSRERLFTEININNIECEKFSLGDDAKCNEVKNFLVGRDKNGAVSNWLGDIIHSTPTVITYQVAYNDTPSFNGNGRDGEAYMFVGSNDGYIHAFDVNSGRQKFSFIPEEFYRNIRGYVENNKGEKLYGFDGPITADYDYNFACKVKNTDNDCDASTNYDQRKYVKTINSANLYVGMRRGGTAYYALNVTEIETPSVKWVIRGGALGAKERYGRAIEKKDKSVEGIVADNYVLKGTDTDVNTVLTYHDDFSELAQTWSKPVVAKVKLNAAGNPVKVLIFSGGYDPVNDNQDYTSPTNFTKESTGNAIFIVNAETGELIKKVTGKAGEKNDNTLRYLEMKYSIPGGVAVADQNGDGNVDEIFAADVRGNIFRIHLPGGSVENIQAAKIAGLGAQNRQTRFFSSPRIALVKNPQNILQYAVAIGSGNRANPRDSSMQNGIFVIFQDIDFDKASSKVMGFADLLDIAQFGENVGLTDEQQKALDDANKAENEMQGIKAKIKSINKAKSSVKKDVLSWFDVKEQLLLIEENKYKKSIEQNNKMKGFNEQLINKEITDMEKSNAEKIKFIDQEKTRLEAEIEAAKKDSTDPAVRDKFIKESEEQIKKYEDEKKDLVAKLDDKKAELTKKISQYEDDIEKAQLQLELYEKKRSELSNLKSTVSSLQKIDKLSILGKNIKSIKDSINSLTDIKLDGATLGDLTDQLGDVAEKLKGKKIFSDMTLAVDSLPESFAKEELYSVLPNKLADELVSKLGVSADGQVTKESLNKYFKDNSAEKSDYDSIVSNLSTLLNVREEIEVRNEFWSQFFSSNSRLNANQSEIDFAEFSQAFIDGTYYADFDSSKLKSATLLDRVDEAFSQVLSKYETQYAEVETRYNNLYKANSFKIDKNNAEKVEKAIFAAGGWKKMFEAGWKSLSPVTIRDHQVRFTGFKPTRDNAGANLCEPDLGQSWEYRYGLKTANTEDPIRLGVGFYESPQLFRTYYVVGKNNEYWKNPVDLDGDGVITPTEGKAIKKPLDCLFGAAGAVEECKDIDVSMNMVYWKNWLETNESYSRVFEDDDSASSSADSDAGGKSADPSGS